MNRETQLPSRYTWRSKPFAGIVLVASEGVIGLVLGWRDLRVVPVLGGIKNGRVDTRN